jgi:signal peptidase I
MKLKELWNKFWFIVWKDDSPKGWIISLIFIFIFIKFIFFPGISFLTGTSLPLAIVESCSMYHKGDLLGSFDSWYDKHEEKYNEFNITQENFEGFSFKKGFNKGDILFITGTKPENVQIGDVIIFQAPTTNPVIHRVIDIRKSGDEYIFETIGDNNNGQLTFEKSIKETQLIGKARIKVAPFIGWTKLIFFEHKRTINEKGFCREN